jgi:hypothetical protein
MKPLDVATLLEALGGLLDIQWTRQTAAAPAPGNPSPPGTPPSATELEALRQLGRIGHVRGILRKLDEIGEARPETSSTIEHLRRLAQDCDLDAYEAALQKLEAM